MMADNLLETRLREMIRLTWGDPPETASFPALVVEVLNENARLRALLAMVAVAERARIVAWLRTEPQAVWTCDGHRHADGKTCSGLREMTLDEAADAIERSGGEY